MWPTCRTLLLRFLRTGRTSTPPSVCRYTKTRAAHTLLLQACSPAKGWISTTALRFIQRRSVLALRGGRAVGTVGQVGAKRPRNSAGRPAPGNQQGAAPAGWGSQGSPAGRA